MKQLREYLEWTDGSNKYTEQLLKKTESYKEIIIFGAGIGGIKTFNILENAKLSDKVVAFSDNNKEKIGKDYAGLKIIAPETIKGISDETLILVSSTAYNTIRKQLHKQGVKKEHIMYFQPARMLFEKDNTDADFIRNNIQKFEEVFEILEDDKSKKIFMSILNYRITKNIVWLEGMEKFIDAEECQYFDMDILKNYCFENGFVDGGAYTGDTLEQFFEFFPQWEGECYCIEAGKDLYIELEKNIKNLHREKIKTYNCALWNKNGTLRFNEAAFGLDSGSHVSETGECMNGVTLDRLLAGKQADFIKLDIEVAERKALIGAQNIIKTNKPILAICVYHRPEDLFEVPLLIKTFCQSEYSFYIRQYRFGQSETVLYAMPKSRRE